MIEYGESSKTNEHLTIPGTSCSWQRPSREGWPAMVVKGTNNSMLISNVQMYNRPEFLICFVYLLVG